MVKATLNNAKSCQSTVGAICLIISGLLFKNNSQQTNKVPCFKQTHGFAVHRHASDIPHVPNKNKRDKKKLILNLWLMWRFQFKNNKNQELPSNVGGILTNYSQSDLSFSLLNGTATGVVAFVIVNKSKILCVKLREKTIKGAELEQGSRLKDRH